MGCPTPDSMTRVSNTRNITSQSNMLASSTLSIHIVFGNPIKVTSHTGGVILQRTTEYVLV